METPDNNDTAARLRRSVTRMNRRLRHNALGGISPAQASLLASIEKLKRPSLGELALEEQVQPPSVTRLARSLEDAGLIDLTIDGTDRRCTRASLTSAGRKELLNIRQRKTEFIESKLRGLSLDEQVRASQLVTLLEQMLDEQ